MKYHVRQVNPRDPEIAALLERMQLQCLPNDIPQKTATGYWWICYTGNGQPAGFAGMVSSIRWEQTGYLSRSGVLPMHQGQGLQKRLIRARISKAKQLCWRYLLSDTSDNPASANSLISCGFKMYEPRIPYGLKTSLYWRRKIL